MTDEFVAVIGGANMDIHGLPNQPLVMQTSNPGVFRTCPGGVARNIAENLARLEVDTRLISAIGDDMHGQILQRQGRDAGIDMRAVSTHAEAPTATYLSILDERGNLQVAIADMDVIDSMSSDDLRPHESMLQSAAIAVVDANLCADALQYLMQTCARQPVFVDPVSTEKAPRLKPWLSHIHTFTPSLTEAETLAGRNGNSVEGLRELASWFHDQGVERLFVTLGENGVFYSTPEEQGVEHVAATVRAVRNTGGAGDAFIAGLAYAWLQHWPLQRTLRFAMASAASAVASVSTISPDLSLTMIERMLKAHYAA